MNVDEVVFQGLHVLAVDDDADSLDLLTFVLEQYDIEVTRAASATQALEIVAQFKLDLLIVDIAMPGMDGCALLRQIRTLYASSEKQIPALALTAMNTDNERTYAIEAGFQVYLTKPFDFAELLTAIASLISGTNYQ